MHSLTAKPHCTLAQLLLLIHLVLNNVYDFISSYPGMCELFNFDLSEYTARDVHQVNMIH